MRCASAASVSSPGSATHLRGRDARALARPVSPFPPRRHRRGAARFASKGDDGSSASPGSSDASPPEGPSFAEAREKFKRDFWDEVANDPGGVPFLKPRDGRGGPRRGDPGAKEGGATEETSGARADPESGAGTTSGHDRRRESFWSRCTLAGLALGVWFGVWGLTSMHWPTVAWTAKHRARARVERRPGLERARGGCQTTRRARAATARGVVRDAVAVGTRARRGRRRVRGAGRGGVTDGAKTAGDVAGSCRGIVSRVSDCYDGVHHETCTINNAPRARARAAPSPAPDRRPTVDRSVRTGRVRGRVSDA